MIGKWLMSIVLLVTIAGCNIPTYRTIWSKPGASRSDFDRDRASCSGDTGQPGMNQAEQENVCLEGMGWTRVEEEVR